VLNDVFPLVTTLVTINAKQFNLRNTKFKCTRALTAFKVYTAVTGSPKLMYRLDSWTLLLKESCQYDTAESIPHEVRIKHNPAHTNHVNT